MDNDTAEAIYNEMQAIFGRNGLDPVPCGYSHGGRGVWYYEFHMKAGHYTKTSIPMGMVLKDCTYSFIKRKIPLDGSGFSWVGDDWWFMHFIVVDYKPGLLERLRRR